MFHYYFLQFQSIVIWNVAKYRLRKMRCLLIVNTNLASLERIKQLKEYSHYDST